MARAARLFAQRVEAPADLPDAVRAVLAHDGPALLDVVTAQQELTMSQAINATPAAGFGLWLAKAVLDGRGTEVVDLPCTNLLR